MALGQYHYNFPTCERWVPRNTQTRLAQIAKIREEVEEAAHEIVTGDDEAYVRELLNIGHAVETALHEFPQDVLKAAKRDVIEANEVRGYYGGAE